MGRPGDAVFDQDVAAAGVAHRRGLDNKVRSAEPAADIATRGVSARWGNGVIIRVDQPGSGLTGGGSGVHDRSVRNLHLCTRTLHETAVSAVWRRGVDLSVNHRRAAGHVRDQNDTASPVFKRPGPYLAAVAHHRPAQRVGRFGAHHNHAAVGLYQPPVLRKRVHRSLVNRVPDQAVSVEVHRNLIPGQQRHAPFVGRDTAFVDDPRRDQRNHSARNGRDLALVDDRTGAATVRKSVLALQKVVVGEVQGRCDQSADVDFRRFAENNAVLVEQEHRSVRTQAAKDLARVLVCNAVQRRRGNCGLRELYCCRLADVEALPVGDHLRGALRHRHPGAAGGDRAAACRNLPAGRQGAGIKRQSYRGAC